MSDCNCKTEVERLTLLLNQALADKDAITWTAHHPDYPPSVMAFMSALARSTWMTGDYQKVSFQAVLNNVSNATKQEVMCALTHAARVEKWCTGEWVALMKTEALPCLMARAKLLVNLDDKECQ